ncbi:MAG: putative branched-chain amino acid transport ATP-binding protein [Alphaproteobacteria bacterium]|jgi:branched-chain amino acid transport system ATP-binding protein|nr:putative branched-chain amino acid transport ATP-binding protein [Alphaproteobacteria bacterium]
MSGPIANKAASVAISGLVAGYGSLPVLREVSLDIKGGTVAVLLGHNGAGKSTLAKALMGLVTVDAGGIAVDGEDVKGLSTAQRLKRGMALVLQEHAVFADLTVLENLRVGGRTSGVGGDGFAQACDMVYELFPILKEFRGRTATSLSGGQQRMLAIGMSMMTQPRFLILDEPSIGLAPKLVDEVMAQIRLICRQLGVTVLLIEQNVEAALKICDQVVALRSGSVIFAGAPQELGSAMSVLDLL